MGTQSTTPPSYRKIKPPSPAAPFIADLFSAPHLFFPQLSFLCLVLAFLVVIPERNLRLLSLLPAPPRPPQKKFCRILGEAPLYLALAFAICFQTIPSSAQTISTSFPLLLPTTVAFDTSGNLYIAETNRHVIDRIDPTGILTVYAGNGTQGFSGDAGPATAAQLDSPQGLALDASGNLYLADTHNHRIRKVNAATGIITTIAGTGTAGFSGDAAAAISAQLNLPTALALDASGNLDLADSNNHRIRQLNLTTGIIATIAGNGIQADAGDNGPALAASIDTPTGLAVDASNNLYLADTHNHRIREVSISTGILSTVAGGGTSLSATTATTAKLLFPRGLSFDSTGNLYLAETQTHRILRIAPDGTLTPVAGAGTQGFAGDNGPAIAALLDSPRSAAISPTGLLTLADTGNQRVRQLDTTSTITTLYGTGNPTPSALTLTSPTTTQYGTGTLTAATPGTGSITFLDTSTNTTLATIPLTANTATFPTTHLPAGTHTLLATYSGDATHAAQQSPITFLTITPAPIAASPTPATITYGQPIPTLTGSITGVLPQDASQVSATFSTAAQTLSPAATYPIATTLTGPSAANYQITTLTPATLTIAQATTATALTATPLNAAITLSTRTISTTQGAPTGQITFFDTGASLGNATLTSTGSATLTTTFAAGTHTVTAVYSGDTNFLSSTSAAVTPTVATTPATQDFTLATSGSTSQTATAGTSAAYTFTVSTPYGPLSSPILLTASGMPPAATATFNPTLIPPGTASSTFTFTIQTTKTTAQRTPSPIFLWSALALLPLTLRRKRRLTLTAAVFLLACITACGNTVSSNPRDTAATTVYPLTITATTTTATGTTLQHTATVTLTLQ